MIGEARITSFSDLFSNSVILSSNGSSLILSLELVDFPTYLSLDISKSKEIVRLENIESN